MSPLAPPDASNDDDIQDMAFRKRGCCFCVPFTKPKRTCGDFGSMFWQRIGSVEGHPSSPTTSQNGKWWNRRWKKVQDWSEVVAGPKWKTLLRKISRRRNKHGTEKFKYDPLSYALNFDQGMASTDHIDDDIFSRGFTSRYSISGKTSMDFDRDLQAFT
ncbi:hypothetical protein K2173_020013 [Erythroxylum novogranatense]|uniref:Uncharacterized protein n=1 Tax=Erythroxylum novogranatense TaxID=1862640 RepID=A0AAV8UA36_9ROSI|nr:hypothetical protein K2173_020013 [Erythroxylum novogranatense]